MIYITRSLQAGCRLFNKGVFLLWFLGSEHFNRNGFRVFICESRFVKMVFFNEL